MPLSRRDLLPFLRNKRNTPSEPPAPDKPDSDLAILDYLQSHYRPSRRRLGKQAAGALLSAVLPGAPLSSAGVMLEKLAGSYDAETLQAIATDWADACQTCIRIGYTFGMNDIDQKILEKAQEIGWRSSWEGGEYDPAKEAVLAAYRKELVIAHQATIPATLKAWEEAQKTEAALRGFMLKNPALAQNLIQYLRTKNPAQADIMQYHLAPGSVSEQQLQNTGWSEDFFDPQRQQSYANTENLTADFDLQQANTNLQRVEAHNEFLEKLEKSKQPDSQDEALETAQITMREIAKKEEESSAQRWARKVGCDPMDDPAQEEIRWPRGR